VDLEAGHARLELRRVEAAAENFACRCTDDRGQVILEATDLDRPTVLTAIDRYLPAT
jgi:hypothetical protein